MSISSSFFFFYVLLVLQRQASAMRWRTASENNMRIPRTSSTFPWRRKPVVVAPTHTRYSKLAHLHQNEVRSYVTDGYKTMWEGGSVVTLPSNELFHKSSVPHVVTIEGSIWPCTTLFEDGALYRIQSLDDRDTNTKLSINNFETGELEFRRYNAAIWKAHVSDDGAGIILQMVFSGDYLEYEEDIMLMSSANHFFGLGMQHDDSRSSYYGALLNTIEFAREVVPYCKEPLDSYVTAQDQLFDGVYLNFAAQIRG